MTSGLHHVSLIASSDSTIEFYLRLGFHETYRQKRLDGTDVVLEGYGITLEFLIERYRPKKCIVPEPLGIRYFSLKVEDFDAVAEQFGNPRILTDRNGVRYCFLWDPDGQKIEIRE